MSMTISFNELRRIKNSLPPGSTHRIADELNIPVDTVRNYFGGHNYDFGQSIGVHLEPGSDGGIVVLDDPRILEKALLILSEVRELESLK
ncbi:MAG: DNA-binding protein [Bacteroidales bacterium]